jgi:16S rRNA (guanine1516-N2)-methyltransferase
MLSGASTNRRTERLRMPPRRKTIEVTLAPPAAGSDLQLAQRFGVPIAATRDEAAWQLVRHANVLQLCAPAAKGPMVLELSATRGPLATRLRSARRSEPLPRAIGLPRRQTPPFVIDATAGLCRDAMVLAHLGCRVVAIERLPALAMFTHAAIAASLLAGRLEVVCGDAVGLLGELAATDAPDVVYLDPMFDSPGRAQVKKEMQICRALAGAPDDAGILFATARRVARERVVVKRHAHQAPLADDVSFTVQGERVRFDVYLAP